MASNIHTLKVKKYMSHSGGGNPVEYGLKLEVSNESGDISPKVFVWQHREGGDVFITVASPCDLAEVPEDAHDPASGTYYYRTNEVELWFRNYKDYKIYSERLVQKIEMLVEAYNHLNNYTGPDNINI